MIKEQISLDETIEFLNEILKLDSSVAQFIIDNRVACNSLIADHESIQVICDKEDAGLYKVGLLGILNGLFGSENETGYIAAVVEKDGSVSSFCRLSKRK